MWTVKLEWSDFFGQSPSTNLLFIQQSCIGMEAVVAFDFDPCRGSVGRVSEKSSFNQGCQNVFDSCSAHLHLARILLGEEQWFVQEVLQVDSCCFGSCVNHGARVINIAFVTFTGCWQSLVRV